MTKHFKIERIWEGRTVAVLGNAPTLEAELLALPQPIPAIVCNQAAAKAPWADMMVSIDANWNAAADAYTGPRIIGFESDEVDAYFLHMPHEQVLVSATETLHIRANLISAIRIAAAAGAAKILVLGIDLEYYQEHLSAPGIVAAYSALVVELGAGGIVVERFAAAKSDQEADHA